MRKYIYAHNEDPRGLLKAYKQVMHLFTAHRLFPLECGDM